MEGGVGGVGGRGFVKAIIRGREARRLGLLLHCVVDACVFNEAGNEARGSQGAQGRYAPELADWYSAFGGGVGGVEVHVRDASTTRTADSLDAGIGAIIPLVR